MKENALQKFTETRRRVLDIMAKPKVTKTDFNSLGKDGRAIFQEIVNERYNTLKGDEHDKFMEKIFDIMTPDSRNSIWEDNHRNIVNEISKYIEITGRMPSMYELSEKTGLSRQTLTKHLKEYRNHPQYIEHLEQFRFMGQRVLSMMFKMAINGNVRAGRLYLEMIGFIENAENGRVKSKNYIQIRNMVLTQEFITTLDVSDQIKIEEVLKGAISGEKKKNITSKFNKDERG